MRSFVQFLIALLSLSVLGWAAWQGYLLIRSQQTGLDPATQSALVIGALVLIICTFTISSAISSAASKGVRASQFENKLALYQSLLVALQEHTVSAASEEPLAAISGPVEMDLQQLLLIGSPQVIKNWNEVQAAARAGSDAQPEREKLLLSMRSDLSQSNEYFLQKELKKLFTSKT